MLLVRIVRLLIFAMALVVALGTAGVDVTALIAGVGVAGVGIGLAMQGILSNLMAGLTIIFTKPFRFGEYIEIAGVQGQVTSIELFTTTLLHADHSRWSFPTGKLSAKFCTTMAISGSSICRWALPTAPTSTAP